MTLVTCLIYYLRTRKHFEINLRDQVDVVAYQLHFSKGIPSLSCNFIPCQEVDKLEEIDYPCEIWSINYRWYLDLAVCASADPSYFRLSDDKMFLRIFSSHHQSFTRKKPALLEILKFCSGEEDGVHFPHFPIYGRREGLSEKQSLL